MFQRLLIVSILSALVCAGCSDGSDVLVSEPTVKTGQSCDAMSYLPHCDGKNLMACKGDLNTSTFETEYWEMQTPCTNACHTIKPLNGVACSAESCDAGTPAYTLCMTDEYGDEYEIRRTCYEVEDGHHYFFNTDAIFCLHGCKDNACVKLIPDEGRPCSQYEFDEYCTNNMVVWCQNDVIYAKDCSKDNLTCGSKKDAHYTDCVETCQSGDADKNVCLLDVSEVWKCFEMTDGGMGYFYADETECSGGCNEATGLCQ